MTEIKKGAVLKLPRSVTFENAAACSQALATALAQQKEAENVAQVLVDAADVENFDSSILAVLLQCRRDAIHRNKIFQVVRMPAQLQELSKLYGVDKLLLN